MQENIRINKNFCIKLANGVSWQLLSTPEACEWVDKLCFIMELKKYVGVNSHNIYFLKNKFKEFNIIKSQKSQNLDKAFMCNTGPLRIYQCQNSLDMICEIGNVDIPEIELLKIAQSIVPIYVQVLHQDGLPLHAALLERDGIGVAIAAPGGTGKSTCASRIPYPWKALCDDELLIVRDNKGTYYAHPFPTWSKCNLQESKETWNVQKYVPISAIFFLKKSHRDKTNFLNLGQSASLIYKLSLPILNRILAPINTEECTIIKRLIFENAYGIANEIPSFILEASLEGKFWEVMDDALSINPQRFVNGKTSSRI